MISADEKKQGIQEQMAKAFLEWKDMLFWMAREQLKKDADYRKLCWRCRSAREAVKQKSSMCQKRRALLRLRLARRRKEAYVQQYLYEKGFHIFIPLYHQINTGGQVPEAKEQ